MTVFRGNSLQLPRQCANSNAFQAQVAAAKETIQQAQSGFEGGVRLVFSGKVRDSCPCFRRGRVALRHVLTANACFLRLQVLEDDKLIGSYNIKAGSFVVALPQKVCCVGCRASVTFAPATPMKRCRCLQR